RYRACENRMKKLFGALLVLLCLGLVSVAHATTTVSTTFETPVNVQTSISTSGCSNSPGPTITLQGALSLGGMGFKFLSKNNVMETTTLTEDRPLAEPFIPQAQAIQFPNHPSLAAAAGTPYI